jgi:hypothetical protein
LLLLAVAISGCFASAPANSEPVAYQTYQTTATDYLKQRPHFTDIYDGNRLNVHLDGVGVGYGERGALMTYTFGGKDGKQHTAQVFVADAPYRLKEAIMDENYDLINNRYIN